ncbi:MAG TPA: hypothetical protein VHC22_25710 [Pirellulales bacterium]|nr:hypothetical protein [Pirellulales bacterium]
MRKHRLVLAFVVSIVWCGAAKGLAQEALSVLPSDTALVLRLASLEKFSAGFKEMVATLGPLANPAVEGIDGGLNQVFEIAADGGAVDRTAPIYLAAFAMEGGPEPVVRVVKTQNEDKLRRAVLQAGADETLAVDKRPDGFEKVSKDGRDWYFARRGEWVLYTRREEVVKSLAFDAATQPTLAKLFAGRAAELASEGDGAVLVNINRLIEVYGDKLDEQRDKLRRQIDNLPKEFLGGDSSATDPRATKKLYADLAELVINAVYDAEWAAGRVNFSAAGVSLAGLLGIKGDTVTSDIVAEHEATSFETLGLLPAGAPIYFAHTSYTRALSDWSRDWLKLAYGENTDATKKLLAALDGYLAADISTTVGSLAFPSAVDATITTVSLTQAKDPEKLRGAVTAYEPAARQQDTALFSQNVELTANAETYQERPIDLMTTHFKFKEVADPGQAIGQKLLEKMFGGSDVQTRVTTLEGMLVQASGNDPKYVRSVVDGLQNGEKVLGLDDTYAVTRDQLPEKVNALLLINVPRFVADLIGMVRSIPPLDMVLAQAPINLGAQPATSYAGFAIGTQPQAVRLDAYIPVTQPQGVLRIFGQ